MKRKPSLRLRSRRRWRGPLAVVHFLHYRLVIPILRAKQEPEVVARGVAVGLFIGLTPTMGFQIPLVTALWWLARRVGWRLNLILALTWTLISNPATAAPLYYLFYKTGLFLTGSRGSEGDFRRFLHYVDNGDATGTLIDTARFLWSVVKSIGVTLLVGALPYAFFFGILGYVGTLALLKAYRRLRRRVLDGRLS